MSANKVTWIEAITRTIPKILRDGYFTKKDLDRHIPEMVMLVGAYNALTPHQTISRELQVLRDVTPPKVRFATEKGRGIYEWLGCGPMPSAPIHVDPDDAQRANEHAFAGAYGPEDLVSRANEGFIYIIRNPKIHNADNGQPVYKCGFTKKDDNTVKSLYERYRTDFGKQALVYELHRVYDCVEGERLLFALIDKYRVEPDSEFFCAPLDVLMDHYFATIRMIGGEDCEIPSEFADNRAPAAKN